MNTGTGKSWFSHIITALVGIIIAVFSTLLTVSFAVTNRLSAIEAQEKSLETQVNGMNAQLTSVLSRVNNLSTQVEVLTFRVTSMEGHGVSMKAGADGVSSVDNVESVSTVTPRLVSFIKSLQKENVRESYGIYRGECFTDEDLAEFIREDRAEKIAKEAEGTGEFKSIAAGLSKLSGEDRESVFSKASETARPTWAQLGKISSEGQTEAGQRAERMIARAVVALLRGSL